MPKRIDPATRERGAAGQVAPGGVPVLVRRDHCGAKQVDVAHESLRYRAAPVVGPRTSEPSGHPQCVVARSVSWYG